LKVNVYTDASTLLHNGGLSGIGVVVCIEGQVHETLGKHLGVVDSATAEVIGILAGLKQARDLSRVAEVTLVRICCDCKPALDLACGDGVTSNNTTHLVLEKIDEISMQIPCPVEFQWVKAHNGNKFNEMADQLAYEHAHG
jgi:ribonuclease HI